MDEKNTMDVSIMGKSQWENESREGTLRMDVSIMWRILLGNQDGFLHTGEHFDGNIRMDFL